MSDALTEEVIGAPIEVHRHLGPGLLESIYEEALAIELEFRGVPFERQVDVDVLYKGRIIKGQRLDLLISKQLVVELKAVRQLPAVTTAQVLSYLKATGLGQPSSSILGSPDWWTALRGFPSERFGGRTRWTRGVVVAGRLRP